MARSATAEEDHPAPAPSATEGTPAGAAAPVPLVPEGATGGGGEDAQMAAIVAGSGTSFFWAMRLLPRPKRQAMYAVYAFCRVVDDIADGDGAPADKRAALAAWRKEIGRLYEGKPQHPISRVLVAPVAKYGLAIEDFVAVIEGMEMDATERMVAPSMAELELYCQRVAGAVGLLSVCIFGINGEQGQRLARSLGQALQLTNLLRDLAEDADAGRLYLPRELLEAHGIEDRTPGGVLAHPAVALVCADLAEIAEGCFAEARGALAACHRGNSRPARVMMSVYHALLSRLKARGFERLDEPVRMGTVDKFWIALREGLF